MNSFTANIEAHDTARSGMGTQELITYALLGLVAIGMFYVIMLIRGRNLAEAEIDNAPKVAGEDELGSQAKEPEQFDEPDDDALDEMEKLLEDAAESQGLEYSED